MSLFNRKRLAIQLALGATALLCGGVLAPSSASAQERDEAWRFRASVYGYTPDFSGELVFPAPADIEIDAADLLENTDAMFMGAFEAQHGRIGVFTDFIYLDLGKSVADTPQLSIGGGMALPPGVTADLSLDIKAQIWTLAGNYRVIDTPATSIDVFAGARMLNADAELAYAFSADFGPFSGTARQGSRTASLENWDMIFGVKGRSSFGAEREWFAQYYADVGAGESDLTWQAYLGAGRSFGRYDITVGWRRLEYQFASDSRISDLAFDGPVVGASVKW